MSRFRRLPTLAAYPLRLPRHSKLNWPQYPPLTSTCQCLPGVQTLPAPAAYLPIGPQPISLATTWTALASNWTEGLFLCNIGFTPKIKLQSNFRAEELTSITPTDKWALVIRDYDTQTLVKGDWIFNPGGMAIKRFSTEIGLACLAVVSSCSRPALSALPSAPYALAPLSRRD